jgi:Na+/melibiose symporter-like transporter
LDTLAVNSPLNRAQPFALTYAVAHGGKSLLWHASELLFAFFLTEICGLPPRQMGLIFGVSLLVNAAADLALGRIIGRWIRTSARAAQLQWAGSLASGAAFSAFALCGLAPPETRFAMAFATILLFRLSYPFLDNPQNAILALATTNDTERSCLAAVRYVAAGVAGMAVAIAFGVILERGQGQALRFAFLAVAAVVIAVASSAVLTHQLLRASIAMEAKPAGSVLKGNAETVAVWPVFLMIFIFSGCNAMFTRLQPYFAVAVTTPLLKDGAMLMAMSAASVVSQVGWHALAQRTSLTTALRVGLGLWAAASVLFWWFAPGGQWATYAAGALYGAANGGVLMALWALAAASSRLDRPRQGATATFGQLTFWSKLAMAVAGFGLGELLVRIDYRDSVAFAQVALPLMAIIPLGGALISLAASCFLKPGRLDPPILRAEMLSR